MVMAGLSADASYLIGFFLMRSIQHENFVFARTFKKIHQAEISTVPDRGSTATEESAPHRGR
jgi:hypothetical protein